MLQFSPRYLILTLLLHCFDTRYFYSSLSEIWKMNYWKKLHSLLMNQAAWSRRWQFRCVILGASYVVSNPVVKCNAARCGDVRRSHHVATNPQNLENFSKQTYGCATLDDTTLCEIRWERNVRRRAPFLSSSMALNFFFFRYLYIYIYICSWVIRCVTCMYNKLLISPASPLGQYLAAACTYSFS